MNWLLSWIARKPHETIVRWVDPYHPLFCIPDIDLHDQARAELGALLKPLATLRLIGVESKLVAAVAEYIRSVSTDGHQIRFVTDLRDRVLRTLTAPGLLDYHIAAWTLTGAASHIDHIVRESVHSDVARWALSAISGPAWDTAVHSARIRLKIPPSAPPAASN